jgi:hypothetical protein
MTGEGTAPDGRRLLSPEAMAAMQTPQCPANLGRQMGLSWFLKDYDGTWAVSHGGATNGQLSAFLMVPARGFAITILTNADEGSMLNDAVVNWALRRYLGLQEPEKSYLELDETALATYTGTYTTRLNDMKLYVEDGRLMVEVIPKGGFPDVDSPPSPAPPPSRLAFFEPDRIIALDPPLINTKAEFIRDESGGIIWLRTSRLLRKTE